MPPSRQQAIPHSHLRRRPPRSTWHQLLTGLLLLLPSTTAQTSSTLADPSLTQLTLTSTTGAIFFLPSPATTEIYITLNLCTPPPSLRTSLPDALPLTLFVSNTSSQPLPGPTTSTEADLRARRVLGLQNGFANVTLPASTEGVWIGVWAPDEAQLGGAGGGVWTYELGVSSEAPRRVLDGAVSFRFEDADATNALLTTGEYTEVGGTGEVPNWVPLVVPTTHLTGALSASACFVQSAARVASSGIEASTTTRGFGGGFRMQYDVGTLEGGTNYTSWLLERTTSSKTRLWKPVYFVTKTGTNCRLVHSLAFCPSVAYAVPTPPTLSTLSLLSFYESSLTPSLASFARTLSTFPCSDRAMGSYSFISTCDTCSAAYLDWACAVAMPRCTDAPEGTTIDSGGSTQWVVPPEPAQFLLRDNPLTSRTPLFATGSLEQAFNGTAGLSTPFPYQEVPPCLEVCQLVGARCPPLVGWGCPTKGGTGNAGYGVTREVEAEGRMAGDVGGREGRRGADRWGNVFCNALGTDMIMAAQFSGAGRTKLGWLALGLPAVVGAAMAT